MNPFMWMFLMFVFGLISGAFIMYVFLWSTGAFEEKG